MKATRLCKSVILILLWAVDRFPNVMVGTEFVLSWCISCVGQKACKKMAFYQLKRVDREKIGKKKGKKEEI